MLSSTCQHVATLQFDSCAEKDSHFILDQCHGVRSQEHKLLPGLTLAQKNCCTVYSLNLIHEFTSVFSTYLLYVGLRRKAFPGKHANIDNRHPCFSVVVQAMP